MKSSIIELNDDSLAEIEGGGTIFNDVGYWLGYGVGHAFGSMGTSRIWWSNGYPSYGV